MEILNYVALYFIYFIFYSVVGYIWEVVWCSANAKDKKVKNRGYLFGPVCPIYGTGLVAVLIVTDWLKWPWWANFFLIIFICDFFEYWTSYIMEKLFHLRWWDYTYKTKYNLNGRISLETSLFFGFGGMAVKYLLHPSITAFILFLNPTLRLIIAGILLAILIVDTLLSTVATASIKDNLKGGRVDLTSEIKKYARNYYRKQSRLRRHIAKQTIRNMKKMQRQTRMHFRKMQRKAVKNYKRMMRETKKNLRDLKRARDEYFKTKAKLKKEKRAFKASQKIQKKSYKSLSKRSKKNLNREGKQIKKEANKIQK